MDYVGGTDYRRYKVRVEIDKPLMSVQEAGVHLGLSAERVRQLVKQGQLPATQLAGVGSPWRVPAWAVTGLRDLRGRKVVAGVREQPSVEFTGAERSEDQRLRILELERVILLQRAAAAKLREADQHREAAYSCLREAIGHLDQAISEFVLPSDPRDLGR